MSATARTDSLREIALGPDRLDDAVALSAEAGWNQVAGDWSMMCEQGQALGMLARDGRLVASALVLPYGDRFGWISMVLVTQAWRQQGLASRLLKRCIDMLESDGRVPVLDATLAGEAVYRPLGFEPVFALRRWATAAAPGPGPGVPDAACRELRADDLEAVLACDRDVFGGEREAILRALAGRAGTLGSVATRGQGYLLARDGRVARQLGPVCADETDSGLAMIARALERCDGPVFMDVPDHQTRVIALLEGRGFAVQRPFLRMAKGAFSGVGDARRQLAVAGPELG